MQMPTAGIDALPEIVWTTRDGHFDWFNQAWYAYTGLAPIAVSGEPGLDETWLEAVHADDRRRFARALGTHAKRGSAFSVELRLRRSDGVRRWFSAHVSPFDAAGETAVRWIGVCTDIDEHKRQGQRFAFIAKAGEALAESLNLQTTLNRLLGIIVPEFGDWAAIDLFDETGRLRAAAAIHADRSKAGLVKRLIGRYNHAPEAEPAIAATLEKNKPLVLHEIRDESIEKTAAADLLEIIRALAPHSAITVPLRSRGRAIGSLVTYWSQTPRHYEDDDLPLFEELTKRAAVAIENARLYEREREVAAEFQRAALPISLPRVAGVRFDSIYVPAGDRELLGGDWYDALRLNDGRIVVSIGDVAGSGLAAAVIMSSMREVIRGVAQVYADPIALLDAADRTLKAEHPETFVTAFVGVFDPVTASLTYASAGHPPPLLRDGSGVVTALSEVGLPLGLRVRGDTATTIAVPEGACLVFYTDGLIEAKHDIIGGLQRLTEAVSTLDTAIRLNPADSLYRSIMKSRGHDDVVVLTMQLDAPVAGTVAELSAGAMHRWAFEASDADAAQGARYAFVGILQARGMASDPLDTAELIFGELIGNVVRYAPGPIEVTFDWNEAAPVLHVLDRGPGFTLAPRLPSDLLSERGRGLYIVWSLAEDFNVTERFDGGSHARAVLATA